MLPRTATEESELHNVLDVYSSHCDTESMLSSRNVLNPSSHSMDHNKHVLPTYPSTYMEFILGIRECGNYVTNYLDTQEPHHRRIYYSALVTYILQNTIYDAVFEANMIYVQPEDRGRGLHVADEWMLYIKSSTDTGIDLQGLATRMSAAFNGVGVNIPWWDARMGPRHYILHIGLCFGAMLTTIVCSVFNVHPAVYLLPLAVWWWVLAQYMVAYIALRHQLRTEIRRADGAQLCHHLMDTKVTELVKKASSLGEMTSVDNFTNPPPSPQKLRSFNTFSIGYLRGESEFDSNIILDKMVIVGCHRRKRCVTYWSPHAQNITGFGSENIIGTDFLALIQDTAGKRALVSFFDHSGSDFGSTTMKLLSTLHLYVDVQIDLMPKKRKTAESDSDVFFLLTPQDRGEGIYTTKFVSLKVVEYIQQMGLEAYRQVMRTGSNLVVGAAGVNSTVPEFGIPSSIAPEAIDSEGSSGGGSSTDSALVTSSKDSARILQNLLEMLDVSYITETAQLWVTMMGPVNVRHVVGQIISKVSLLARRSQVKVDVHVDSSVPAIVYWDEEKLKELLSFILTFAVSRTPRAGRAMVEVTTGAVGSLRRMEIIVHDTSKGFEENQLDQMLIENVISLILQDPPRIQAASSGSSSGSSGSLHSAGHLHNHEEIDIDGFMISFPRLAHNFVRSLGQIACSPRAIFLRMPLVDVDLGFAAKDAMSVDTTATVNTMMGIKKVPLAERIDIGVYQPNEVFRLGILQCLWATGNNVVVAKDIEDLFQIIEERRPHVLFYDADTEECQKELPLLHARCAELSIMLVTMYFYKDVGSLQEKSGYNKNVLLLPFQEEQLDALLSEAYGMAETAKTREAQVSKMRQMFSEHKAGKWTRGDCIGVGTSGEVYVAYSELTRGTMAVKIIPLNVQSPQIQAETEALINEIDILRTLTHPNIIHYFYCERTEQSVNIFMEYASGGSLQAYMKRRVDGGKRIKESQIARILSQVLDAVAYIHDMGIVHRDIKAANILMSERCVKLSDFGTAKRLEFGGKARGTKGTVRWMAPEVMRDEPHDQSCDIWSIGCLCLEMITGKPPFSDVFPESPLQHFHELSQLPEDAALPMPGGLQPDVLGFLDSCLQLNPNLRSTARSLLGHPFLCKHGAYEGFRSLNSFAVSHKQPSFHSPVSRNETMSSMSGASTTDSQRRRSSVWQDRTF